MPPDTLTGKPLAVPTRLPYHPATGSRSVALAIVGSASRCRADKRRIAAANGQIGIAKSDMYPTLSISALGGILGTSLLNWLMWPSRFWTVGPGMSPTLFEHGLCRSNLEIARFDYYSSVAAYRQGALTAFQEVEDNLAELRDLETEARQHRQAIESADQLFSLFQARYEGGLTLTSRLWPRKPPRSRIPGMSLRSCAASNPTWFSSRLWAEGEILLSCTASFVTLACGMPL